VAVKKRAPAKRPGPRSRATARRRDAVPRAKPFPPGEYPVVVVGSGPGGLQLSYFLSSAGINHAVLSADPGPAGMFRRFPLFQKLNTWSKPFPPAPPTSRHYAWYDWNSLLADEPAHRALVTEFMDGSTYFPTREQMELGVAAFCERAGVAVRYGCRWESTRAAGGGFALGTSDGEYRCKIAVFAIGMAEPWKPEVAGIELVPHYAEAKISPAYAGRRVLILGKRTSGFEMADAILPWARQIILVSPRPALLAVNSHSTAGVRARYLLPYEDHVFGGGVFVLDAATQQIERTAAGYRIQAGGTTRPGSFTFEVDYVLAATGWTTPLGDLRDLGVATFSQNRIPALTPFWESTSVPGVFFAGAPMQGAVGLRKHGVPANSGGLGGYRHNARVLAAHLARTHLGIDLPRPEIRPEDVVPYLLSEASTAAELWNQRSYLARVVSVDRSAGIRDEGILPLQYFVDSSGPDAVAIVQETDQSGDHHPAVYVRRGNQVTEHVLDGDPLLNYQTPRHTKQLGDVLAGLL
jgi:thioredoxin reductase